MTTIKPRDTSAVEAAVVKTEPFLLVEVKKANFFSSENYLRINSVPKQASLKVRNSTGITSLSFVL